MGVGEHRPPRRRARSRRLKCHVAVVAVVEVLVKVVVRGKNAVAMSRTRAVTEYPKALPIEKLNKFVPSSEGFLLLLQALSALFPREPQPDLLEKAAGPAANSE